ncbi:MAG: RHS repeat-associated core domain-containing protein, partial [Verrucomicrobiota bacterium]
DYTPYGERITRHEASGYTACDIGFTGHITLPSLVTGQTELVLAHYRAYDPKLGGWLSADPLGEDGGVNLYAYVHGLPTGLVDPLGLDWYNPTTWNWGKVGEALKLSVGIGIGVKVKPKLGPVKCCVGADYTWTADFNGAGEHGSSIGGSAGGDISVAKYKAGIKGEGRDGFMTGSNGTRVVEESKNTKGIEKDECWSKTSGEVGIDATVGVIRLSFEVDLVRIWEGITSKKE